ncbi:MAG: sugar acetyltransferase [Alphaproteobacteria bacterium]|nr:sugar acetyltransferase [Alphaproteobacteria bacterium]
MSAKPFIIIGAGGHGRVVLDVLRQARQRVLGFVDADPGLAGTKIDGARVLGGDDIVARYRPASVSLANGLGNMPSADGSDLEKRRRTYERWRRLGYRFPAVVSPAAIIASFVEIGEGAQIMAGAIVQTGAVIGANAVINTGAQVDHDGLIGDHAHVAPGAVLSGAVVIGARVHVGAGAVIVQGLTIGADAVIAAGAVVVRRVAARKVVMGAPARPKSQRASARPGRK